MATEGEQRASPSTGSIRRFIFWDFARASWQYDVVVGLILICIFAIPRDWFKDQPKASSVVLLSSGHATNRVFIDNVAEANRTAVAEKVIHQRTGKNWRVDRIEPIRDEAEHEVKGYIAYTSQPN